MPGLEGYIDRIRALADRPKQVWLAFAKRKLHRDGPNYEPT
jgi:hypothetical protein